MPRQHRFSEEFDRTAARQDGAVTRRQWRALGVGDHVVDRKVDNGRWTQLSRGVVCVRQPTWRSWVWAGVLLAGRGAVVGGEGALQLAGARLGDPLPITVWSLDRRRRDEPNLIFRRGSRSAQGRIPHVAVPAALVEAAGTVDEGRLIDVVGRVLETRAWTASALWLQVERSPRVPKRTLLRDLLSDQAQGVASPLEWRWYRDVERAHGLPTGRRQVSLTLSTRSDVVLDEFRIVVELDGRQGHTGRERFRDMTRDNVHAQAGWTTLRYGWTDVVTRPCAVARQVSTVLKAAGWERDMSLCKRCRADRQLWQQASVDHWPP